MRAGYLDRLRSEWLHRLRTVVLILGVGVGVLAVASWTGAEDKVSLTYNAKNLIRLHVLADSDGPEEQAVKLLVRDRILRESKDWLIGAKSRKEALGMLREKQDQILAVVQDEIRRQGRDYGARIQVGVFPFPTREYSFGMLPAGNYTALRVVLGRGQGHNWWCVLFPPMCFMTEEERIAKEAAEKEDQVVFRWLLLERLLNKG
jgi:stage II sporulation protein R